MTTEYTVINDLLPAGTYHVLVHFVTKRGPRYLLRVTHLPSGLPHEFSIWPSQFNALVNALVGQHHPETGIANAQLLLDVEYRLHKKNGSPYNRITSFRRPSVITPMQSDVRPQPPAPESIDF